jgi:hypothetical protein
MTGDGERGLQGGGALDVRATIRKVEMASWQGKQIKHKRNSRNCSEVDLFTNDKLPGECTAVVSWLSAAVTTDFTWALCALIYG